VRTQKIFLSIFQSTPRQGTNWFGMGRRVRNEDHRTHLSRFCTLMTIPRVACAVFGFILVTAAVSVFQFAQILPTIRLVEVAPARGTAEITNTYQLVTAGPSYFYEIQVDVKYPARVHQDQTLNIRALVSQDYYEFSPNPDASRGVSTDPVRPTPLNSLQWPVDFSLSGAAFTIDPRVRSFPANSSLPMNVQWTVLAKHTGTHALLLDVSRIKPIGSGWHSHTVSSTAFVNGVEIVPSQLVESSISGLQVSVPVSELELSVEVLTSWGISQRWVDVITVVLCFIGFVLSWPFLGAMVTWILRRTRAQT